MKVVLTGASGFVGVNLISYLKDTFDILTISRSELANVNAVKLNNNSTVVHLAGKAHDTKKTPNPDEYYQVNFKLTQNIYDAFLQSDVQKFIYISSVKAVADTVNEVLTEEAIPNPQTHYGKSKLMAEEYIRSQPLPKGKTYYILRPCMIHGPGNKGNLNLLYKFIKKRLPYPLAGFENRRSFLSIGNLCFLINELINRHDIPGGIYNISDDEALSTNDVVAIMASSMGTKPKLWRISPLGIKLLAKVCDRFHLPLTTERLNKLTETFIVSNEKIKGVIKKELPLTTSAGLKITADSFLK